MATVRVKLNNAPHFNQSLVAILSHARRPALVVMEQQAKGIVGRVIGVTPPSGKLKGIAARKAGEKTTAGNIRKVLQGVPVSSNRKALSSVNENEVARQHQKYRVAGQIKGRHLGKKKKKAPAQMLNRYIRRRQKAVGMLAAGWNTAAAKFKVSGRDWPSFVRKHNPPGQASIKTTSSRITIRFANRVRFAGGVSNMPRRLNWALGKQTAANNKIMAAYKGAAKRAGFRVV
jgi:hypothetical protein